MIITRKYIMKFRTDRGAWTKPQIEALGIDWPPRKGWIDRVVGKEIRPDNQIQFEARIGITKYRKQRKAKDFSTAEQSFDTKKVEALRRYEERKTEEQLDREALTELDKFI